MSAVTKEAEGLRLLAEHVQRVQSHLANVLGKLAHRMAGHDLSKYEPDELALVLGKKHIDSVPYMTEEYKQALEGVRDAVDTHWARNDHHPEYYLNGIEDMDLLSILEMLCDWKGASEMTEGGNIYKSIAANAERFKLSPQLVAILENTAKEMGWNVQRPRTEDTDGGTPLLDIIQ